MSRGVERDEDDEIVPAVEIRTHTDETFKKEKSK